jgi:hypothetical protein
MTEPARRKAAHRKTPKPVVSYSRDAVLDHAQLAAGLGCSVERARKMDLPSFPVGGRDKFIWGQVLDTLAARARRIA